MNHYRELLERDGNGGLLVHPAFDAAAIASARGDLAEHGEQAICFDMGDVESLEGIRVEEADLDIELPYPVCWFEFACGQTGQQQLLWGLLVMRAGERIRIVGFSRVRGAWMLTWLADGPKVMGKDVNVTFPDGFENAAWACIGLLLKFLTALQCRNVVRLQLDPPAALNKARLKRGKQPLFSYWVLHLQSERQARGEALSKSDRAGPRVHLRRGHVRRCASGIKTWVAECIVGNAKAGMVHKDYRWAG